MSFLSKLIQTAWKACGVLVNCKEQEEDNGDDIPAFLNHSGSYAMFFCANIYI